MLQFGLVMVGILETCRKMTEKKQAHLSSFRRLAPELARHCTVTSGRSCRIIKYLPCVNALLNKLNAEVKEITPGRLFLCQAMGIGSSVKDFEDVPAEEGVIFLYCLLRNHHCLEAVELKPHLRRKSALVICDALCYNQSLTCLRVHHASLSHKATLSLFTAVHDLLKMQLRELSLEKLNISFTPEPLEDVMSKPPEEFVSEPPQKFMLERPHEVVLEPPQEFMSEPPRSFMSDPPDYYMLEPPEDIMPQALEDFKQALSSTQTLTKLTLLNVRERIPSARTNVLTAALTGLQANKSVTSLKVDTSYCDGMTAMRNFLDGTRTLAELHVYSSSEYDSASADLLFNALETNNSVKRLTLRKFAMKDMWSFTDLLDVNKNLEDVSFYACPRNEKEIQGDLKTLDTYQGPEGCMNAVVKALKRGTSLRRLTLDWPCTPHMVYCLLAASKNSPSFTELHLGDVIVDDADFLHGVFIYTRADVVVTAARCMSSNGTLSKLIPLWEPGDTASFVDCLYNVNLMDVGRALSSDDGDYVTSLSLQVGENSSSVAVHALSLYLTSTPKLRELQLRLGPIPRDLQLVLLSAFQKNVSIERLSIFGTEDLCIPEDIQNTLFTWMANSKRLYSINVDMHKYDTTHLLGVLAASEGQNYVLTSLTFKQCWADESVLETTFEMVRRNRELLRFAAAFVHGAVDKRALHAYDSVYWHPQLPEVVQSMGCSDRAVAKQMIHEAAMPRRTDF
ncbi:uncharacterized protein LOC142579868 isoform X2 [Dermacentor variabilis]|uniref:uncharacterized protein LOC142579868 isoform X2 n=1 Tax=Dermacentor variabilis TaxID=34621 RepID=UPI003F5BF889